MNAAFKVETLDAGFDNPHHVLVMGVASVGVSDEPSMQDVGTARSLAWEEPCPFGRLSGRRAHRHVT